METSINKRRRILLHFLLGVGLPSLLLGYLAFRGIQNDQALLEKQTRNEHRAIGELIAQSVNESIGAIEGAFLDTIATHRGLNDTTLSPALENLKSENPLIEEVFFLESSGRTLFPVGRLLYLPEASPELQSSQKRPASVLREIEIGQQHEFRGKNYPRALAAYRRAFARASDNQVKGELLTAIARVQKKSTLFQDAINSYTRLSKDFGHTRMASGMPAGLAAELELGSLFLAINDSLSAIQALVGLYKRLVDAEWALTNSQYVFFVQQVRESMDEILTQSHLAGPVRAYEDTVEMLDRQEESRRSETRRLLTFREGAATPLLTRLSRDVRSPPSPFRRFTLGIGGRTYLGSLLARSTSAGSPDDELWGFLLDSEKLRTDLLQPVIQRHAGGQDIRWAVRGPEGEALLTSQASGSGTATIRADMVGNFPPWSLELYQRDPRLVETLLTSPRGIYLYIFILLAGILIFGLTLTIRTVTREIELARMQSDFVSTISHEFKSPLTSIRQLAEMLHSNRVPSEERRRRYYDVLLEQSERLSLLIDNILDFAKMEEGEKPLELAMVDVGALLDETASTVQHRVRHEEFVIEVDVEDSLLPMELDGSAIAQATINLIDNAIKYSGESKKVIVRGFTENQHVVIAIQDFGIGISKDEIGKVFERFYRGGSELTRTVKGTGLGLTLVKQIVEAHHGAVHVESEPGQGSTFSMRLPLRMTEDA